MEIDRSKQVIFLPIDSNEDRQIGHIRVYKEGNHEFMEVSDADDTRFNGVYLIHLQTEDADVSRNQRRYSLVLESKDIYLYAEKVVVSFP